MRHAFAYTTDYGPAASWERGNEAEQDVSGKLLQTRAGPPTLSCTTINDKLEQYRISTMLR